MNCWESTLKSLAGRCKMPFQVHRDTLQRTHSVRTVVKQNLCGSKVFLEPREQCNFRCTDKYCKKVKPLATALQLCHHPQQCKAGLVSYGLVFYAVPSHRCTVDVQLHRISTGAFHPHSGVKDCTRRRAVENQTQDVSTISSSQKGLSYFGVSSLTSMLSAHH